MRYQVSGESISFIPETVDDAMGLLKLYSECDSAGVQTKIDRSWPANKEPCLKILMKKEGE